MIENKSGNVLFLILIAVALFAALSYAVTQSSRGGGNASSEKSAIDSSVIVQNVALINTTIQKLQLMNGCSDTQISFLYDSDGDGAVETNGDDNYYNPNAPTNGECDLFNTAGGGLSYSQLGIGDTGRGWFFSGKHRMEGVGGDGVADQELMSFLAVNEETCLAINRQLGLPTSPLGEDWYDKNHPFLGAYLNLTRTGDGGGNNLPYEGTTSGCLIHSQPTWGYGDSHFYYNVIITR